MNIFLVNHYAGSDEHGMEYRPLYMAREWTRAGHDVTIIAASYAHVRSKQPKQPRFVAEERIQGVRYLWVRTPPYEGNGIGRTVNMLCFTFALMALALRFVRLLCPDAVIASSTYPLDIFPCALMAKLAKARLLFEVHDLWPLSPRELGNMSRWHPAIVLMQVAENFAYRRSDAVISMLPKAKDHMVAHGLAPTKFIYVPNGICLDEWTEIPAALLAEPHASTFATIRAEGRFSLCYAGAHGVANALGALLQAAALLRDEPVTIVLVGHGPEKAKLDAEAKRLGLMNVVFLPPVPKPMIPALLARADAVYIGLQRQPLFRFGVSPNKLLDYLIAGRPILHAIEAGNDLVQESGSGISVEAENPRAIADGIRALAAMPQSEREACGRRGRAFVIAHHDYRKLADQVVEAIRSSPSSPGVRVEMRAAKR